MQIKYSCCWKEGSANALYFFQSMPIFSNVIEIILFMSVARLAKVIELLVFGADSDIHWLGVPFTSIPGSLLCDHVNRAMVQSVNFQTLCSSAVPSPHLSSFCLLEPSVSLKSKSVLLLLLLTIACVHSREEQLTNSWIVFVYMSELKANYLINVFCLVQKCYHMEE